MHTVVIRQRKKNSMKTSKVLSSNLSYTCYWSCCSCVGDEDAELLLPMLPEYNLSVESNQNVECKEESVESKIGKC